MYGTVDLTSLLQADVGDGIEVQGRPHAITAVGQWTGTNRFKTREYTLGDDEDFYLVIEGSLDGGDPGQCRAVLTHELNPNEVRYVTGTGKPRLVTSLLAQSDTAPGEIVYHGRPYTFSRRLVGRYTSESRQCPRVTWDYESRGRNLAIERWPEQSEMAVYEGQTLALEFLRVIPNYRTRRASGRGHNVLPLIGMAIGILMMIYGFFLLPPE